jgi:hypothetical protein
MGNISDKNMRNEYYRVTRGGYEPPVNDESGWGLRHAGTWPSDWAPRRTCQLCKKQFRTDNEEGFSSYLMDVCAPCIYILVKAQSKEKKRLEAINDAPFKSRMDEIHTQ